MNLIDSLFQNYPVPNLVFGESYFHFGSSNANAQASTVV